MLSYLAGLRSAAGPFVGRIALASCVAFAAAALADTFAYHLLRHRPWFERANQSNLAGAAVDSAVFVALWPFAWSTDLAFTLFAAKVAGGVVWTFLLEGDPMLILVHASPATLEPYRIQHLGVLSSPRRFYRASEGIQDVEVGGRQ